MQGITTYLRFVMTALIAAALLGPMSQGSAAHAASMPLSAHLVMAHDPGMAHDPSKAAIDLCAEHCLANIAILPSAPALPMAAVQGAAYAMPMVTYSRFELREPPGRPPKPVLS